MKKFLYIIIFLAGFSFSGNAQLFHGFNQYMTEGLTINPAFAGSREVLSTAFFYRNMWTGFDDGAPTFQTLSAHTPLINSNVSLGVLLMHQKEAVYNEFKLSFNYAYRASLRVGKLSFGLKAGLELFNEDYGSIELSPRYPQDPVFSSSENYYYPNFGVGIYYYNRKFFTGLSVPSLLMRKHTQNEKGVELTHDFKKYNYFFTSGVHFNLSEATVSPAVLIKYTQNADLIYGGNINVSFLNDRFSVGAGYNNALKSTIIGLLQIKVNEQLRIGYSYDTSVGYNDFINLSSHEIMLRYEFRYIIDAANPLDF